MKSLRIVLILLVLLALPVAVWANFAWGEHSYHSDCYFCGNNFTDEPGRGGVPVITAWDKHLTYNGVPGTLACPASCSDPLP